MEESGDVGRDSLIVGQNDIMNDFAGSEALLEFPRDEGAHQGVRHEWWYFNGHVLDKEGHSYGLMVCFFNIGKLYLAITDEDNNEFHSETVLGALKAAPDKLDVSVGNNWWIEKDNFIYEMHLGHPKYRLKITMTAEKPPLLIGGHGQVRLGNGGTSYYYSQTRLRIDGWLMLHDSEKEVGGIGWIDRQWGNWDFSELAGWEWFSIQLDDGSEIQLSHLVDSRTGASITPMLNIMRPDGAQETLSSYELEYLDYWTHPETGNRFSHGWRVCIPAKDTELVVTPTVDDQLLHPGLWEGSCEVVGRVGDQSVKGRAYVELLLNIREMRLVRIAKHLISLSRVREWWEKLQSVFAAVLILLVLNPVPADRLWLLPLLALYMAFVGSYGYALNSYSDREQDRKVQKLQELRSISDHHLLLTTCFFACGTITIPLLFSDVRINVLGLITFLLATFYSVKPLRFKERGMLGIIVPALAQRPLPFLFFVLLIPSKSALTWYLFGWLTIVGLIAIFAHQLLDFKNDREAGVDTWVRRVGFNLAKKIAGCFVLLMTAYVASSFVMFGITGGLFITVVLFISSENMIANSILLSVRCSK